MRSPMCEALMKRATANLSHVKSTVASAGLHAVSGRAAHPWAIAAAREWGVSLEDHRARCLTAEMLDRAEAIFVMDYQNQVQLMVRYPQVSHKVYWLSAYASTDCRSTEIADPYYLGPEATRKCYGTLNSCIENLVQSIAG